MLACLWSVAMESIVYCSIRVQIQMDQVLLQAGSMSFILSIRILFRIRSMHTEHFASSLLSKESLCQRKKEKKRMCEESLD